MAARILPASASDGPIKLRLRNGELSSVGLGIRPAGIGATRVAEDPPRKHDEALGRGLEVRVPAWLVERVCERRRQIGGNGLIGLEVQGRPDLWLVRGGALDPVPADL